jgi:small subunit ribosomal protein S17
MKKFSGKVVSTKMEKTVIVLVETRRPHPFYKKVVKKRKKYHVHDELGVKEGEMVEIVETRPISKLKKWKIVRKIGGTKSKPTPKRKKEAKKR